MAGTWSCRFVFHAPGIPLAEGVVCPIPAIFAKEADAVLQVVLRPRCPCYGAEFANIDLRAVPLFKIADCFQNPTQIFLVVA